jgi:23S rRNA (adenine2030-N6)-methyltransferase
MNYRHAFHAGNFADVFKHVVLVRLLRYLCEKDTALFYLDTHAGPGVYDLADERASRTGEWRNGIARLAAPIEAPAVKELLAPYLTLVGPIAADGKPDLYPGSPKLAQRLLRRQDRLTVCELHPDDAAALSANFSRDPRVKVLAIDGYTALKAFVPPKERRGLVFIDPPFESPAEFDQMTDHIRIAQRKWATGVYAVWYPIKNNRQAEEFARSLINANKPRRMLRLCLDVGNSDNRPGALTACAIIIINPPFPLEREAAILLPFLATRLAQGADPGSSITWLAGD